VENLRFKSEILDSDLEIVISIFLVTK
jgi:hypothetical protein